MIRRQLFHAGSAFFLTLAIAIAAGAQSLPQVNLNADNLRPRAIEQLTGTNLTRDYAIAWRGMEQALEQNRTDLLKGQFTGFAQDRLAQRIEDQRDNGLRMQIVDHGHRVKAVFYSLDGGAMQLVDDAQIQVRIFDGSRLVDSEDTSLRYIVLMTPGADRWYVRYLEQVPSTTP
ncbi:MAG: hypothetical protein WB952_01630 [Terriglobales bacterium]